MDFFTERNQGEASQKTYLEQSLELFDEYQIFKYLEECLDKENSTTQIPQQE